MKAVRPLLTLVYPFLVYVGLERLGPRHLAALLGVLVLLRAAPVLRRRSPGELRSVVGSALALGSLGGAAAWLDDGRIFLILPVATSGVLLVAFARTLRRGPSMIERFARLQVEHLSGEEVLYCRNVTRVWCGFFLVNGAVAGALAMVGSLAAWTLYTGAIAYALMGLLFAGEIVVRSWRFRRYEGAITDPILRRIFPPKPAT